MNIISAITFDLSRVDANAWTIFLIGFGVVFVSLIFIYLFFAFFPLFLNLNWSKLKRNKNQEQQVTAPVQTAIDSEVYAAIAMALNLHFEDAHDVESMILTIDIKNSVNSQWNSKVQNVNFSNN